MKEARPSTPEGVYAKWVGHLQRLCQLRDRQGDDLEPVTIVQLNNAQEIVDDLGFILYGTNGHGRVLHPEEDRESA